MRRLPVYLVIDISESMAGDNLRHMQEGISRLINVLRADPYALETVHLSVIAFAGVARTLAPLVELYAFYPPRLPVGSGTSIGAALEHVMDEISANVVASSPTQKGDYKPVVYFMSDGKATDNPAAAIARWQRDFARRATLVTIGIGPYADLSLLSQISAQTLRLEKCDDQDFKHFIQWISNTVSAQSKSLGVDVPLTLDKAESPALSLVKDAMEAAAVDENYVIITGICAKTRLPYLRNTNGCRMSATSPSSPRTRRKSIATAACTRRKKTTSTGRTPAPTPTPSPSPCSKAVAAARIAVRHTVSPPAPAARSSASKAKAWQPAPAATAPSK